MLSKADDFPIHQTPEPIAYSGTDRNFYDRYFFNGYNPDGSGFFAVAFGVYPHLNVADAHVSVIRDGVEHCVHASRILHMERFELEVGPIRIEVLEPLKLIDMKKDFAGYEAFDIGAMGEFDVDVLVEQYAGQKKAAAIYPAWRGGYYFAGKQKADKSAPIGLLYVSRWSNAPQFPERFGELADA